jgi:hypothetical protein
MSNAQQSLEKSSESGISEDIFERRYKFFVGYTVTTLEELTRLPNSEQIFSLRIVGAFLMLFSLILKSLGRGDAYLTTIEFLVVFLVATLLLILGSYFSAKDQHDKSRVVQKTGQTFINRFEAHTGLLNPQNRQNSITSSADKSS